MASPFNVNQSCSSVALVDSAIPNRWKQLLTNRLVKSVCIAAENYFRSRIQTATDDVVILSQESCKAWDHKCTYFNWTVGIFKKSAATAGGSNKFFNARGWRLAWHFPINHSLAEPKHWLACMVTPIGTCWTNSANGPHGMNQQTSGLNLGEWYPIWCNLLCFRWPS